MILKTPGSRLLKLGAIVFFMLFGVAHVAYSQNRIEKLTVLPAVAGAVQVQVEFKEPRIDIPSGFLLNQPPRLVFDFNNTTNGLGKRQIDVSERQLKRVNIVEAEKKIRLVLELTKAQPYQLRQEGKSVFISLLPQELAATGAPVATPVFADNEAQDQRNHTLKTLEFHRGQDGQGRIEIELSDPQVAIDMQKQGQNLVVDMLNTQIPIALMKQYDVIDFATPVERIETSHEKNKARLVIHSKGPWEHLAYQTQNRLVIDIKKLIEEPNQLVQAGYSGEKLSLNFQNVEVRAVLQVLADFTGLNIITSESVKGNLTLRLKEVPWDQALDIILRSKGLDKRKEGTVVWIAPREELTGREKQTLQERAQLAELEPLQTQSFQLNYHKALDVMTLLKNPNQSFLSKRGSVVIDVRTNQVFVQETQSRLQDIQRLVQSVDVPVRQVMIESRIVEANDNFSRTLGARLAVNALNAGTALGGSLNGTAASAGVTNVANAGLSDFTNVSLPASGSAGLFSMLLFNQSKSRFLGMEISALQADGKGKIVSSPRVITANQSEALIEQGTEIPYQAATSSGATSVSFKKATLAMRVTPQITPDDHVIMTLKINKDSVSTSTITTPPAIDTKQITTQVLVENGGTVVIGGIYQQNDQLSGSKVPGLGDIPYLGQLFKQTSKSNTRSELLVFITPKILKENLNLR